MYRYRYVDVHWPDWAPLERVAELTAQSADLPTIEPGPFMYMGRLESAGRPALHLYKHGITRCYLNLDDQGHTYVYVWGDTDLDKPFTECDVYYEALPDLRTALDRLDLHLDDWSPQVDGYAAESPPRDDVVVPLHPRRSRRRPRPDCA